MQLDEIERRMRPGGWSSRPLLLRGQRLERILAEDARQLAALRVTAEVLGQALADLLKQASRSDWFHPFQHSRLDVEVRRRRGFITCPWAKEETEKCRVGQGGYATANEFFLRHRSSGRTIAGFELSAHLIRDHAFLGGPGTVFRIEPAELAFVLELPTSRK